MNVTLNILFGLFFFSLYGQGDAMKSVQDHPNNGLQKSSLSAYGLDSLTIHHQVDSIITNGIKNQSFPGAQILIVKKGDLIFHESYGYHTYDSIQQVRLEDLYDLASVTKILGPLPAIMKLVDAGKLDLDVPFSNYWKPWKRRRNKKDLTLRQILAHQAGLQPYIVFLNKALKNNGEFKKRFVRKNTHKRFNSEAFEGIFVKNNFNKKVFRNINRSKVSQDKTYRYSGLAFLIFPELITELTGTPYQDYIRKEFYIPIGIKNLTYLPSRKKIPNTMIPTELDTLFRHSLTQGWVHDENAALLGGISGNAGLFGTALDVAKMMQMYMCYGIYNNKRYISKNTLKEFTSVQFPENENRRGLGFDKPYLNNSSFPLEKAYPAPGVSAYSFGHSGFTGTFAWACLLYTSDAADDLTRG